MWTTLNFKVRSKTKSQAGDIYRRTVFIEFELDWSVGLGAMLGDGHTENKKKNIFLASGIFPGKSESVILFHKI